jgi:hypothetical protein
VKLSGLLTVKHDNGELLIVTAGVMYVYHSTSHNKRGTCGPHSGISGCDPAEPGINLSFRTDLQLHFFLVIIYYYETREKIYVDQ